MSYIKHSAEVKAAILKYLEESRENVTKASIIFNVPRSTVQHWYANSPLNKKSATVSCLVDNLRNTKQKHKRIQIVKEWDISTNANLQYYQKLKQKRDKK